MPVETVCLYHLRNVAYFWQTEYFCSFSGYRPPREILWWIPTEFNPRKYSVCQNWALL